MKNNRTSNGYILVYKPDHHKAIKDGNWKGYVYEHVIVAEEMSDRKIKEGEEVHHLDENRSNNSPENLIILPGTLHRKLHGWLNKHEIIPNEKEKQRIKLGCIRCKLCEKPIDHDAIYCSQNCAHLDTRVSRPTKETLEKEIIETPMTKLGEKYGVSDNAVKKWCKNYEIELKPMRGHWTKKKFLLKIKNKILLFLIRPSDQSTFNWFYNYLKRKVIMSEELKLKSINNLNQPTAEDILVQRFKFDYFGKGSLLEQAAIYAVNSYVNEPLDNFYLSKATVLLNILIQKELSKHSPVYLKDDTVFHFEVDQEHSTVKVVKSKTKCVHVNKLHVLPY